MQLRSKGLRVVDWLGGFFVVTKVAILIYPFVRVYNFKNENMKGFLFRKERSVKRVRYERAR